MATKRRHTGYGCLILVVVGLALLIASGRASESRASHAAATPTVAAGTDAYGWPVGAAERLFAPMHMPATQAGCVEAYIEKTQSYATIQAVLLTDAGQKTLADEVQAVIAAKCPA